VRRSDYSVVTLKFNCCKEMTQASLFRTDYTDYPIVTFKSKCCKEISPGTLFRTGCTDYSIVTFKSKCCKEMLYFTEVPIIPSSRISSITVSIYGRDVVFRPS
jgi:hypothetical protein